MYLYSWDGSKLTPEAEKFENNRGQVSALAFSPDGSLLVAGNVRPGEELQSTITDRLS